MIRLNLVVEGQTEETFVNQVLVPHLADRGIYANCHCVTTSRGRHRFHRGGMVNYQHIGNDLRIWMAQDQDAWFSTFIDLYALPANFPGFDEAKKLTGYQRVIALEKAWAADVSDDRFVPFIALHEFEALLLTDPQAFAREFPDDNVAVEALVGLCAGFESPELINDRPEMAPSQQIIKHLPAYEGLKSSAGPLIAEAIGLATIRARCPHFAAWLDRLESL